MTLLSLPLLLSWVVALNWGGGIVLAAHPIRVLDKNAAEKSDTGNNVHILSIDLSATPEPTEEVFTTAVPTPERVSRPSVIPSASPTVFPSASPSAEPTTAIPTFQPTIQPSEEPTSAPTESPSSNPTDVPSSSPTVEPTEHPTISPTTTQPPQPSGQPSGQPTHATALVGTFYGDVSLGGLPDGCCDNPDCVAKWELTLAASSNSLSSHNIDITECSTRAASLNRRLVGLNLSTLVAFAVSVSEPYDKTINITAFSKKIASLRAAMVSHLGSPNFTSTLAAELLAISFINSGTVLITESSDVSPVTVEVTFTRAPSAQPTSVSAGSGSSGSISRAGLISIAVVIPGFFCIVVMTAVYFVCCGGGSKGDGSSGGSKEWIEMPHSPHSGDAYIYGLNEEAVADLKDSNIVGDIEILSMTKMEDGENNRL